MRNEPVRITALVAGALVAASTALLLYDAGASLAAAVGVALGDFGIVFAGGEVARQKAWGPQTVDQVMDAEAVITAAEHGRHG